MSDDVPSWVSNDVSATTVAADAPTPIPASPPAPGKDSILGASPTEAPAQTSLAATMMTESTSTVNVVDQEQYIKLVTFMRAINMGVAVAIVTVSVLECQLGVTTFGVWILAMYASCGGCLVCLTETELSFFRGMIASNFGFLFNSVLRFIFYLLLGTITWTYGLMGQLVAGALVVVACYNTFIICKYPAYKKMKEEIADEAEKKVNAKIQKEMQKQVLSSVMGPGK